MDLVVIAIFIANVILMLLVALLYLKVGAQTKVEELIELRKQIEQLRSESVRRQEQLRQDINNNVQASIKNFGDLLLQATSNSNENISLGLKNMDKHMQERLATGNNALIKSLEQIENRLQTYSLESSAKLENIKNDVEKKLTDLQKDNNTKLEEMRKLVDEKLQKTLNERMTESFKLVNDRLEQVYKGLGEMQTLAQGVGDLKKVMSNVKTRGILGEIQLGAILEEILSPEQYSVNIETKKGSGKVVEYAVKLPSEDGSSIYLPIDAKFPGDTYGKLRDAYERGNPEEIQVCIKALLTTIRAEAKDIRDKYLDPPYTTDFAIMFLPFEGLYAEVVNRGMIEVLQREFQVNIAGPSTMAALLNSLQMGFKTFAIQQRSSDVWKVLGAVKTEFDKFADALKAAQARINQANEELDKLVGTRTRKMQVRLRGLSQLTSNEAEEILALDKDNEQL
ncbi:MAG TPA: DNA recombination protein RmuC [Candidatus Avacidaminococcus intestinavium]|uniref:DNA recombination protein RmuC n=1 Tax=Candidatus Avacidaminococcus intestinavium TaxID=2840684 RepID=A0A9D1MNS6_9FIRM|nr:DNA recombination protein RmuC [Candidatus Avacidaminococcus intestinavium]